MFAAEPLVRKSDGVAADDVGAFRQRDFGARGVLFEGFRERDQVTNLSREDDNIGENKC